MRSLAIVLLPIVNAFYLPGVAPHDFVKGEKVELKVNKLSSTHTQIPYDYYSHKFCKPESGVQQVAENLGEFLTGDRIENSPYSLFMKEDAYCQVLCQETLTTKEVAQFKKSINDDYHHNWIIDNLPAAAVIDTEAYVTTSYSRGFPIGYQDLVTKEHFLYNHVNLIIKYHELAPEDQDGGAFRVVGFFVEPFSVKHAFTSGDGKWDGKGDVPELASCQKDAAMNLDAIAAPMEVTKGKVVFSYDVIWKESNIRWASRWDIYLSMDNAVPDKVHWFSVVNSLLIVLFLTGMIGMILLRNLHRDITRYNRVPTDEEKAEEREETGWKLVHGDVFRPPSTLPMLFCVLVGTGTQLLMMALITICFAAVGFLSPANRGSLMIAMLLLYVVMGAFAGYYSANLYKTFKGRQWQKCTLLTAFLYPTICFATFLVLDIVLASYGSTAAVPVLSMFAILALWFGISVPLVFLGAYVGFRKDVLEFPVKSSSIPRPVPDQPWYLGTAFTVLVGGVLPFGACFVELFFILSSMWMDQYYYVFGFLMLVFVILLITCAEIVMVLVYFQLCAEDYHWWWRAFLMSGSTAFYVMLYSAFYFSKLETNFWVTYMLYFGYMLILCLGLFLLTGAVGFFSALWFTKKIYASIKVD